MRLLLLALALTACGHEYPRSNVIGIAPEGKPPVTQESVLLAMDIYEIQKPASCQGPFYDPTIEDRGLTTQYGGRGEKIVTIGPAAFSSWGVLGSTLAHEFEIHCNQNFLLIRWKDLLGFDGSAEAEGEAYFWEVDNAKRFGLTMQEVNSAIETYNYYYARDSPSLLEAAAPPANIHGAPSR